MLDKDRLEQIAEELASEVINNSLNSETVLVEIFSEAAKEAGGPHIFFDQFKSIMAEALSTKLIKELEIYKEERESIN